MNKHRVSLIAGFMPPLIMGALMAIGYAVPAWEGEPYAFFIIMGLQLAAFLVPTLLIKLAGRLSGQPLAVKMRGFTRKSLPFILSAAIAASLLTFLINWGLASLLQWDILQTDSLMAYASVPGALGFLAGFLAAAVPALAEELFFRGAFFSAFEERGTALSIFLSALAFALMHGSVKNLAGPMIAGLVYGYLAYVFDSVWPAVLAHFINNLLYALIGFVVQAYSALGIWNYFIAICAISFFMLLTVSMKSLERLIELGKVKRFKASHAKNIVTTLAFLPGLWLLIIIFALQAIYF